MAGCVPHQLTMITNKDRLPVEVLRVDREVWGGNNGKLPVEILRAEPGDVGSEQWQTPGRGPESSTERCGLVGSELPVCVLRVDQVVWGKCGAGDPGRQGKKHMTGAANQTGNSADVPHAYCPLHEEVTHAYCPDLGAASTASLDGARLLDLAPSPFSRACSAADWAELVVEVAMRRRRWCLGLGLQEESSSSDADG